MSQQKRKFTIPKISPSRELLQSCDSSSREYGHIASEIERSLLNSKCGLKVTKIEVVNNEALTGMFNIKKLEMQKEISAKRLEVSYGFKYVENYPQAKEICMFGLSTNTHNSPTVTCLGDPKYGIYLSRCADFITQMPPIPNKDLTMVVFQVMKGKSKLIAEQHGKGDNLMEPTPSHDCHLSRDFRKTDLASIRNSTGYGKIFDSCQIYLYEVNMDIEDLYVKRPRHCVPYAVVSFRFEKSFMAPSTEGQPHEAQQKLHPVKTPDMPKLSIKRMESTESSSEINYFSTELEKAKIVWSGKISNKATSLTDVVIRCHTQEFTDCLPLLGNHLSLRMKVDIASITSSFPHKLFSVPPIRSKNPRAHRTSREYLHCEMYPKSSRNTTYARLKRSLTLDSKALMRTLPLGYDLFILPTCELTRILGITFTGYPDVLHLLFTRSIPADDGGVHSNEGFLTDARNVLESRLIELEKLKLITPVVTSLPIQDTDANLGSLPHDDYDLEHLPVFFSDMEKDSIRLKIQRARHAATREMIMAGNKKFRHVYKTPYFEAKPGGRQHEPKTAERQLFPCSTFHAKVMERSDSQRTAAPPTSLPPHSQSQNSQRNKNVQMNSRDDSVSRKTEQRGLASNIVPRDPRLSRSLSSNVDTRCSQGHKSSETESQVLHLSFESGTQYFSSDQAPSKDPVWVPFKDPVRVPFRDPVRVPFKQQLTAQLHKDVDFQGGNKNPLDSAASLPTSMHRSAGQGRLLNPKGERAEKQHERPKDPHIRSSMSTTQSIAMHTTVTNVPPLRSLTQSDPKKINASSIPMVVRMSQKQNADPRDAVSSTSAEKESAKSFAGRQGSSIFEGSEKVQHSPIDSPFPVAAGCMHDGKSECRERDRILPDSMVPCVSKNEGTHQTERRFSMSRTRGEFQVAQNICGEADQGTANDTPHNRLRPGKNFDSLMTTADGSEMEPRGKAKVVPKEVNSGSKNQVFKKDDPLPHVDKGLFPQPPPLPAILTHFVSSSISSEWKPLVAEDAPLDARSNRQPLIVDTKASKAINDLTPTTTVGTLGDKVDHYNNSKLDKPDVQPLLSHIQNSSLSVTKADFADSQPLKLAKAFSWGIPNPATVNRVEEKSDSVNKSNQSALNFVLTEQKQPANNVHEAVKRRSTVAFSQDQRPAFSGALSSVDSENGVHQNVTKMTETEGGKISVIQTHHRGEKNDPIETAAHTEESQSLPGRSLPLAATPSIDENSELAENRKPSDSGLGSLSVANCETGNRDLRHTRDAEGRRHSDVWQRAKEQQQSVANWLKAAEQRVAIQKQSWRTFVQRQTFAQQQAFAQRQVFAQRQGVDFIQGISQWQQQRFSYAAMQPFRVQQRIPFVASPQVLASSMHRVMHNMANLRPLNVRVPVSPVFGGNAREAGHVPQMAGASNVINCTIKNICQTPSTRNEIDNAWHKTSSSVTSDDGPCDRAILSSGKKEEEMEDNGLVAREHETAEVSTLHRESESHEKMYSEGTYTDAEDLLYTQAPISVLAVNNNDTKKHGDCNDGASTDADMSESVFAPRVGLPRPDRNVNNSINVEAEESHLDLLAVESNKSQSTFLYEELSPVGQLDDEEDGEFVSGKLALPDSRDGTEWENEGLLAGSLKREDSEKNDAISLDLNREELAATEASSNGSLERSSNALGSNASDSTVAAVSSDRFDSSSFVRESACKDDRRKQHASTEARPAEPAIVSDVRKKEVRKVTLIPGNSTVAPARKVNQVDGRIIINREDKSKRPSAVVRKNMPVADRIHDAVAPRNRAVPSRIDLRSVLDDIRGEKSASIPKHNESTPVSNKDSKMRDLKNAEDDDKSKEVLSGADSKDLRDTPAKRERGLKRSHSETSHSQRGERYIQSKRPLLQTTSSSSSSRSGHSRENKRSYLSSSIVRSKDRAKLHSADTHGQGDRRKQGITKKVVESVPYSGDTKKASIEERKGQVVGQNPKKDAVCHIKGSENSDKNETTLNWYDAEELMKYDVSNDGFEPPNSREPNEAGSEKRPLVGSKGLPVSAILSEGHGLSVSEPQKEASDKPDEVANVFYGNMSPISDADDSEKWGQNYKVRSTIDVPEAFLAGISELDSHILDGLRQDKTKSNGGSIEEAVYKCEDEEAKAIEAEMARVDPVHGPFRRHLAEKEPGIQEKADEGSTPDTTAAAPAHDTSIIMQDLMSFSQSKAFILSKNPLSPTTQVHSSIANQERDTNVQDRIAGQKGTFRCSLPQDFKNIAQPKPVSSLSGSDPHLEVEVPDDSILDRSTREAISNSEVSADTVSLYANPKVSSHVTAQGSPAKVNDTRIIEIELATDDSERGSDIIGRYVNPNAPSHKTAYESSVEADNTRNIETQRAADVENCVKLDKTSVQALDDGKEGSLIDGASRNEENFKDYQHYGDPRELDYFQKSERKSKNLDDAFKVGTDLEDSRESGVKSQDRSQRDSFLKNKGTSHRFPASLGTGVSRTPFHRDRKDVRNKVRSKPNDQSFTASSSKRRNLHHHGHAGRVDLDRSDTAYQTNGGHREQRASIGHSDVSKSRIANENYKPIFDDQERFRRNSPATHGIGRGAAPFGKRSSLDRPDDLSNEGPRTISSFGVSKMKKRPISTFTNDFPKANGRMSDLPNESRNFRFNPERPRLGKHEQYQNREPLYGDRAPYSGDTVHYRAGMSSVNEGNAYFDSEVNVCDVQLPDQRHYVHCERDQIRKPQLLRDEHIDDAWQARSSKSPYVEALEDESFHHNLKILSRYESRKLRGEDTFIDHHRLRGRGGSLEDYRAVADLPESFIDNTSLNSDNVFAREGQNMRYRSPERSYDFTKDFEFDCLTREDRFHFHKEEESWKTFFRGTDERYNEEPVYGGAFGESGDYRPYDRRDSRDDRDRLKSNSREEVSPRRDDGRGDPLIYDVREGTSPRGLMDDSYLLRETRKTRHDFIEHHIRNETKSQTAAGYDVSSSGYPLNSNSPTRSRFYDAVLATSREHQPRLESLMDIKCYSEGGFARKTSEIDERSGLRSADYRDPVRPLDSLQHKRIRLQHDKQSRSSHSFKGEERPFFGEVFIRDDHQSVRRSARGELRS